MVYFLKHVQKQARLSNKVKTHSIFSPNFLSINKEFFLKRPKSLCGISRENFKEQLFKLQIEFSDNNKEEIDNTEKEPLSASITLSKTKEMIESSPLLRKTIISKGKDVSPEKKSLRIRSITNNYIKTSIKSLDMKEKNSDSNFKDSLFLSKTPGAEKKQHIFNYPSTILKKNIQFSYQDSIFKLNNEKKKMFVSPKNKKIEEFKGYMEKKNIREKSKDKEKISLNSSPLNSLSVNKKDIYILQKNIRFLRETNGDLNALAKRETTSNRLIILNYKILKYYFSIKSPIKKKQLMNNNNNNTNQKLKTLKDLKSISDIDIDKESLMQLNRYTNQFFAQKVKETIFNNNNSKSNEKKLENFKFIRANGIKEIFICFFY